jgi:hypothetical protein
MVMVSVSMASAGAVALSSAWPRKGINFSPTAVR